MATLRAGTVNSVQTPYTGGSSWNATRTIVAGDLVVFPLTWEDAQTLVSVTDTAGGTWAIAIQLAHGGGAPQPIGALAYCLSHPGGTNVVITGAFSGSASPILEADVMCFQPGAGNTFVLDGTASGVGSSATFVTSGPITTTGPGVVVQFLSGFQLTSGVVVGGTPVFTRDSATENGAGRSFAQYLLSGSAQTVTPGCSWGSLGGKYVLLAAAFKEVASGGSSPAISATSSATPRRGDTVTVTGSNFGATQGTKDIRVGGVIQTPSAWADGSISFVLAADAVKCGVAVNVQIFDAGAASSNAFPLTGILPQLGWSYVDVGTPNTTATLRLTFAADATAGDQSEWDNKGGLVTVASDLTFVFDPSLSSFQARLWTNPDGFGAPGTQLLSTWTVAGSGRRSRAAAALSAVAIGPLATGSVAPSNTSGDISGGATLGDVGVGGGGSSPSVLSGDAGVGDVGASGGGSSPAVVAGDANTGDAQAGGGMGGGAPSGLSGGATLDGVAVGGGASSAGELAGGANTGDVQVGGGGSSPTVLSGDANTGGPSVGGGAVSQPSGDIGGDATLDGPAVAGGASSNPSGSLAGDANTGGPAVGGGLGGGTPSGLAGDANSGDVQLGGGGSSASGSVGGDADLGGPAVAGGASSQPAGSMGGAVQLDDAAAAGGGSAPSGALSGDADTQGPAVGGGLVSQPSGSLGGAVQLDDAQSVGAASTPSGDIGGGVGLDGPAAGGGGVSLPSGAMTGDARLADGVMGGSMEGGGPVRPPAPDPFGKNLRRTVRLAAVDHQEVPDLSPIEPGETITLEFVFAPYLTASAPAVALQLLGRADGLPAVAKVGGLVVVDGNVVLQRFAAPTGAAIGRTWRVSCTVTTETNEVVIASGRLPVGWRA